MRIGKRQGQLVLYTRPSGASLPLRVGGVTFLSNARGERLRQLQEKRGQHNQATRRFSGAALPLPFAHGWLIHLLCYSSN